MESCRSSDSELERELAEKEREIQQRDQELTHCYRTIAGKSAKLFNFEKSSNMAKYWGRGNDEIINLLNWHSNHYY